MSKNKETKWIGVAEIKEVSGKNPDGKQYKTHYLNFYRDVKIPAGASMTLFEISKEDREAELSRLSALQEEGKISAEADINNMVDSKLFRVAIDTTRDNNAGVEVLRK